MGPFYQFLKVPKTKLFLATMQARIWAAVLEWNESHTSQAFLQPNEPEPDEREKHIARLRDQEANWRRGWFDRIWHRILNDAAPEFPDLDCVADEEQ